MLTTAQQEALQEIANIGMGQAGAEVAQALDHFVQLSIPQIHAVSTENLAAALKRTVGDGALTVLQQSFHSLMSGNAVVIFNEDRCRGLPEIMGGNATLTRSMEIEMLTDLSHLLISACLKGIAAQLQAEVSFSPPSLIAERVSIDDLLRRPELNWPKSLLVEINFSLENHDFACHLGVFMGEEDIRALANALDQFLENY
jgi:chemotaxis protein CheC